MRCTLLPRPFERWYQRLPVRMRMALWHGAVTGVILVLFALITDRYLTLGTLARVDGSLRETAQLTVQALDDEDTEEGSALDVATQDVVREVRYRDRQIRIYDARHQLLAVSDTDPIAMPLPTGVTPRTEQVALQDVLNATMASGAVLTSVGADDAESRVFARRTSYRGDTLLVVIVRSLSAAEDVNEAFVGWIFAAIPVAILLSGAGGYLIARNSLAPALAMGRQAEHISSSRFDARLALANPHDELGKLAAILNRMLERLHASFVQQRQFMSDASHELRTPIAVVRSAADMELQQTVPSVDSQRAALALVSTEGKRLTRIVEDLFLLARADSDEQPLQRELVFLEEIVVDVAKAGRALGRERNVSVLAAVSDESPFSGDPSLLGRLLLNLVDNAIKHSPAGSTVRVGLTEQADIASGHGGDSSGSWYCIAVEDSGTGVAASIRATLFDRFVRDDTARGRQHGGGLGGAGLGLSIAQWIAGAHGGRVVLDKTSDAGTRFVVWLPQPQPSLRRENPVE